MEKIILPEHINVKTVSEAKNIGVFDVEGLYRGYGMTIGNALRRVLLSSLPGAAITQVKIKGVGHEFSTIEGIVEDVVEVSLNLKKVRFSFDSEEVGYSEPVILTLKVKGEGEVTAKDIEGTDIVKVSNPTQHIATISKKGTELEMELTVEKGLGYVSKEDLKAKRLPVGVIQLDALFSPVTKVNYEVENMRVGEQTNFNKVRFSIETDGGIKPSVAFKEGLRILSEHINKISDQLSGSKKTKKKEEVKEEEEK